MSESIYVRNFSRDLSFLYSDSLSGLKEGQSRKLTQGTIQLLIAGKKATKSVSVTGKSIEVIREGGDLLLLYFHDGGLNPAIDFPITSTSANRTFGDINTASATLGGPIWFTLFPGRKPEIIVKYHRVDFGKKNSLSDHGRGHARLHWRYSTSADYQLLAQDVGRGFAMFEDPESGGLALDLGYRPVSPTAGNYDPIELKTGPYKLVLHKSFSLSFHFADTIQPFRFEWKDIFQADLLVDGDRIGWATESGASDTIRLVRVDAGAKWISARTFRTRRLQIWIGSRADPSARTALSGPQERFAWHADWPDANNNPRPGNSKLVYHHPGALDPDPPMPGLRDEYYHGLTIAGLADRDGGPARFDVDWAALTVARATPGTIRFDAGVPIDLPPSERRSNGNSPVASSFLPKPVPGTRPAERRLCIPVERTAFLTIDPPHGPERNICAVELKYAGGQPKGDVKLAGARLRMFPFDLSTDDDGGFDFWTLRAPPHLVFPYGARGVEIPRKFAEGWAIEGATGFPLAGHANGEIRLAAGSDVSTLQLVGSRLRYAKIAAQLVFDPPDARATIGPAADINVGDIAIDPLTPPAWLLRNEGPGDVVYRVRADLSGAAGEAERVVERLTSGKAEVFLKLAFGLQARLKRPGPGGQPVYWPDMVSGAERNPGLAFDLSNVRDAAPWTILDWTEAQWKAYRRDDPELWPAYLQPLPLALDPSQGAWRGHMVRDLQIGFPEAVKKNVAKYSPFVRFYSELERAILLDYGWHDGRGWTFRAAFDDATAVPFFTTPLVALSLRKVAIAIAASRLVRGNGELKLDLPFLQGETGPYSALFGLRFGNTDKGIELIALSYESGSATAIATFTQPLPGVQGLSIKRIETDLKSLTLIGTLRFDGTAQAFLGLAETVEAELMVPFEGAGGAIEVRLPKEQPGGIDGWGIVIRSLKLQTGVGATISGSINLGVDGFLAVHFECSFAGSTPQFTIKGFTGQLAIGDCAIKLEIELANESAGSAKKVFRGTAGLISPLTDEVGVQLKIGEVGGDSYWIGALRQDGAKPVGFGPFGGLDQPTLILGRRVKRGDMGDAVRDALVRPSGTLVYAATERNDDTIAWLDTWQYDGRTDFLIGASGFLGLDRIFMRAPSDKAKRTGIMLTSGGYFRIEAHSKFFGLDVDYDITIDTANDFIAAGFSAPKFDVAGGLTVSGGYVGVGVGYGSTKQLSVTVGWPYPTLEPADGPPDWSRAVTVRWDGAFPLNTFAGGAMVHWADGRFIRLGVALRAGWTKSYKPDTPLVKAEAELGVMVGGVLYFEFPLRTFQLRAPGALAAQILEPCVLPATKRAPSDADRLAHLLFEIADAALRANLDFDPELRVALYIDIWGSARVTLMGIELVGIRVEAHARVSMKYYREVYFAGSHAKFSASVKIGCKRYSYSGKFNVTFIDKPRPSFSPIDARPAFPALAAPAPVLEA